MGDRYGAGDGWTVEVVRLAATPDRHDGEWIRVRYFGYFVADVRRVADLERWFPLARLELEPLTGGCAWVTPVALPGRASACTKMTGSLAYGRTPRGDRIRAAGPRAPGHSRTATRRPALCLVPTGGHGRTAPGMPTSTATGRAHTEPRTRVRRTSS